MKVWTAGDWNLAEKHSQSRHEALSFHLRKLGLIKTKKASNTNFMCMKGGKGESKLDFACHSPELKTVVRTLDHEEFPLNVSTHIPLIYEIDYEKVQASVDKVEEVSEANKEKIFFKYSRVNASPNLWRILLNNDYRSFYVQLG